MGKATTAVWKKILRTFLGGAISQEQGPRRGQVRGPSTAATSLCNLFVSITFNETVNNSYQTILSMGNDSEHGY